MNANTNNARKEIQSELNAMLDCYPSNQKRNIKNAISYIESGKMDEVISNMGATPACEIADLAISLAQIR